MPQVKITADDLRELAQRKLDEKYAMTDRMCSMLVQVEIQLDNNELKKAIKTQNELIMLLIIETRKLS